MLELALDEQETSISQAADNRNEWVIVSSDKVWQARLEKMGFKPTQERSSARWYHVPATCVIVRKAPNVKPKSEEQLARARETMKALHAKQRAQKEQDSE